MLLISYDIQNDKTRTHFSKFLKKYGHRIQYSVFDISNSERLLTNILEEIKLKYDKRFTGSDSVAIFPICEGCKKKIIKMGYAKTEDSDIVFL